MNEVIEIKGIRQSEDGTEMLILAPEKNLFDTILDKRIKVAEMRIPAGSHEGDHEIRVHDPHRGRVFFLV